MTRILLIRHGNTDLVTQKLCGRLPGISLNDEGLSQSQDLAQKLRGALNIDAVYSSPLERATETAAAIAASFGLRTKTDDRLSEMDFGEWTGMTFEELQSSEQWHIYNRNRSRIGAPGGESALDVQARAWRCVFEIAARDAGQTVAVVTHGDVIRALVVLVLGMSLDNLLRIEVAPASRTEVILGGDYPTISGLNIR